MNTTFHRIPVARPAAAIAVSLALCSAPCSAQSQTDGGKGWFLMALVPAVGEAIKNAFSSAVGQSTTCVFGNLLSFTGTQPNYNCKPAVNPQGVNNVPIGGVNFNAAQVPLAAPIPPAVAQNLSTQPILSFVVKKLASDQPHAAEMEALPSVALEQGAAPNFTLRSGDAFAISFATSVPGRVKLINTDANKSVSTSPTYEAIPGNDNRMPRAHEGGILMTGATGTEYLEVEFVPCISSGLAQDPRVAGFVGHLPPCGNEAAVRQYQPAKAAGDGGVADYGGKAMRFPANGDPSQPVAIAPTNYTKGEMLRFRIVINHVPRGF